MKNYLKGTGTGRAPENIEKLRAELATAKDRIATLESKLASKREAVSRLLADDLRTCEELARLQEMIWGYHRGLPGRCTCDVCVEVEQSRRESRGLIGPC